LDRFTRNDGGTRRDVETSSNVPVWLPSAAANIPEGTTHRAFPNVGLYNDRLSPCQPTHQSRRWWLRL